MEYTTLGTTGRKVSRIGFGGAPAGLKNYLGDFDPAAEQSQRSIIAAVERALELGINYYDTAPGYGNGQSESVIGQALEGVGESCGVPLFIATKAFPVGRSEVRASVEASLKRLKRDSIDLLQFHGDSYKQEKADAILDTDGIAQELVELKQEGLVKFIGFTTEDNNDAVYRFIRSGIFDCVQMCYNFLYQHPYDPVRPFGSLLEAKQAGMGTITMRTSTSDTFQRWIQMVNPANTFDYTPALIQFVLSNPNVDVALIGMREPAIVEKNAAIVNDPSGRIDIDSVHKRYV